MISKILEQNKNDTETRKRGEMHQNNRFIDLSWYVRRCDFSVFLFLPPK